MNHHVNQPNEQIEKMRKLMLETTQQTTKNKGKMNKGVPIAKGKKQQQQHGNGAYGQLQIEIWNPGGSQQQQQRSHEQDLMILSAQEYDAVTPLQISSAPGRKFINAQGGMNSKEREAPTLSFFPRFKVLI